jgi:hypothetical protein
MSGMVAGWIVSTALIVACGFIAFVLAGIVNWLDQVSATLDGTERPKLAQDARPTLSDEMRASATVSGAVESDSPEHSQPAPLIERRPDAHP